MTDIRDEVAAALHTMEGTHSRPWPTRMLCAGPKLHMADADRALAALAARGLTVVREGELRTALLSIPQRVYQGANRYDTDDTHTLHLWADGQSWDIICPKVATDDAIEVHVNTGEAEARAMAWSDGYSEGFDAARQPEGQ